LAVVATGYRSEDEALRHGQDLMRALQIIGTRLHIGIDPGKDQLVENALKEGEQNFIRDVHGLCVYEENLPVRVISVSGSFILGTGADTFIQELTNTYIENPKLSEKQVLALELYNSSHFELSLRARFLTLVTVVEPIFRTFQRSHRGIFGHVS
jgi:hypothetical protein